MRISDIQGTVELKNGVPMPYLGLGVFQIEDGEDVQQAVKYALSAGYRHIDTASLYGNERGVGRAIKESGVLRNEIFVTSKVWNSDQRNGTTLHAFDRSMKLLGFEYLDLYLVHWPVQGKYIETWKALERLYSEGRVRAIGVSNFLSHHLDDLLPHCTLAPMVNQMEFHPRLVQQELIDYCKGHAIQYEAWSPLMQGKIFTIQDLCLLAKKYNKDVAQLVLRWNLQKDIVTIPKSMHRERIISNAQIFDFEIIPEDMKIIDRLDKNERIGADPDNFNF
jgi:methylglyoxal/glyoxal reductase